MKQRLQQWGVGAVTGTLGAVERLQSGVVFNPFAADMLVDPYPTFHALRAKDPVHKSWFGAGWVITRFSDVNQLLRDPRLGNDLHSAKWWKWIEKMQLKAGRSQEELDDPNLIMSDPPRHTRLRALVNKAFTPDSIRALGPSIERITQELLDDAAGDEIEVVQALAYPLPLLVIAELIGVPIADREQFRQWSDAMAGATGTFAMEEIKKSVEGEHRIQDYLRGVIEERRREPKNDLLSRLIEVEEDGERLTTQEMLSLCSLLLVAGNATTRGLIANGLLALLRHPDQLARVIADPAIMDEGINELARYDSSVQLIARFATEDLTIGGKRVKKGSMISMLTGAANRDPERFPDPDRLDLTRDNRQFLVFGHGIHYCLGHYLARMEGRIAIQALIARYPRLRLGPVEPTWGKNWVMRSVASLPITV